MYVTMITFLCPFLLESPSLNIQLLWKLGINSTLLIWLLRYIFQMKTRFICLKQADISNISKQGSNTCYVALRGVNLISYSSQTRSGTAPLFITSFGFPHNWHCIGKVWKKSIEQIFFQGNDLKPGQTRARVDDSWRVSKSRLTANSHRLSSAVINFEAENFDESCWATLANPHGLSSSFDCAKESWTKLLSKFGYSTLKQLWSLFDPGN